MQHGGISHQGVGFEEVVGNRRKEDVLRVFDVDGKLDTGSGYISSSSSSRNSQVSCIAGTGMADVFFVSPSSCSRTETRSALGMMSISARIQRPKCVTRPWSIPMGQEYLHRLQAVHR